MKPLEGPESGLGHAEYHPAYDARLDYARLAILEYIGREPNALEQSILDDGRVIPAVAYAMRGYGVMPACPPDCVVCRSRDKSGAKAADHKLSKGRKVASWPTGIGEVWRLAIAVGEPRNWKRTAPEGVAVVDLDNVEGARPLLDMLDWHDEKHVKSCRRPVPGRHFDVIGLPENIRGELYADAVDGDGEKLADVLHGQRGQPVVFGGIHPTGRRYEPPSDPNWRPGDCIRITPKQAADLRAWQERRDRARAGSRASKSAAAPPTPPSGVVGPFERAYVNGVLEQSADRLRRAKGGTRAKAAYREAANVGRFSEAGGLVEDEAMRRLVDAAVTTGLRPAEARSHVRNGWRDGIANPRGVPAPPLDETPDPVIQGGSLAEPTAQVDLDAFLGVWITCSGGVEAGLPVGARSAWRRATEALVRMARRSRSLTLRCGDKAAAIEARIGPDAFGRTRRQYLVPTGLLTIVEPGYRDWETEKNCPATWALTLPEGISVTVAGGDRTARGETPPDVIQGQNGASVSQIPARAPATCDALLHPGTRRGRAVSGALRAMAPGTARATARGTTGADLDAALATIGPATLDTLRQALSKIGVVVSKRTAERHAARAIDTTCSPCSGTGRHREDGRDLGTCSNCHGTGTDDAGAAWRVASTTCTGRRGRPASIYAIMPDAAAALTSTAAGEAICTKTREDAAADAERLARYTPRGRAEWAAAEAARSEASSEVREAAKAARRGPQLSAAPCPPRLRRDKPIIARTPDEIHATVACHVPDVPAWLDEMDAGLATINGHCATDTDGIPNSAGTGHEAVEAQPPPASTSRLDHAAA